MNTQLMKVLTEVALSLHISDIYSQTIGPGPNSKKKQNATTAPSSRFDLSFYVAYQTVTRHPMIAIWFTTINVFLPNLVSNPTPMHVPIIFAVFTIAEPWLGEKLPASLKIFAEYRMIALIPVSC